MHRRATAASTSTSAHATPATGHPPPPPPPPQIFDEATTKALLAYAESRQRGSKARRLLETFVWIAVAGAAAWFGDGRRNALALHWEPDARVDDTTLVGFYAIIALQAAIMLYLAVTAPNENWNETHPSACAAGAFLLLTGWATWCGAFWGVFGYAAPFVALVYFSGVVHVLWLFPFNTRRANNSNSNSNSSNNNNNNNM